MRVRGYDYRRAAFGETWTDDNSAPGGHNGCDTRNDILDRDLVDKTFVVDQAVSAPPWRPARCTIRTPTRWCRFVRGNQIGRGGADRPHRAAGAGLGSRARATGPTTCGCGSPTTRPICWRSQGKANQDKGDQEPADWMPPNRAFWCQYAVQFAEVLRGYGCRSTHRRRRCCATPPRPARPKLSGLDHSCQARVINPLSLASTGLSTRMAPRRWPRASSGGDSGRPWRGGHGISGMSRTWPQCRMASSRAASILAAGGTGQRHHAIAASPRTDPGLSRHLREPHRSAELDTAAMGWVAGVLARCAGPRIGIARTPPTAIL